MVQFVLLFLLWAGALRICRVSAYEEHLFGLHLAELVKNMVIALSFAGFNNARLFEQVIDDLAADNVELFIKRDFDPLAKTTTVVVSHSLGVTKRLPGRQIHTRTHTGYNRNYQQHKTYLDDRVGFQQLLLYLATLTTHFRHVLQHKLSCFRFASARFAGREVCVQ